MEKPAFSGWVREGADQLGVPLEARALDGLEWLAEALVRWNARVNLTAILDPKGIADKHILDALSVLRILPAEVRTLVDVGTGAGFPGLPLALARTDLEVTLVEAVAKKVGFLKHAIAHLGLAPRVRALQATVRGDPGRDRLGPFDAAVSRALTEPGAWAALARPALRTGGTLVVMSGGDARVPVPDGYAPAREDAFRLPLSGDARTLRTFTRVG